MDSFNSPAILLQSEWDLKTLERENPGVAFESFHESRTSVADLTADR
jgi:hypothetical protein